MWIVWLITGIAALIAFGLWWQLRPAFQAAARGWRLLGAAGIPLGVTGLNFVARFWHPSAGPYRANELYPYGNHLQTWAVSFGFAWLAFGLLFAGLASLGAANHNRLVWLILLASWLICWLPHGIIGLAFAWAGNNAPSVQTYRQWVAAPGGFILLLFNSLTLLTHFGLSLVGFVLTGIDIRREHLALPTASCLGG